MTNARMKVESPRCPSTQSACLPAGATAQVMRGRDEVSPGRCGSGGNLCEPVNQPACDGGLHSRALGDWGGFGFAWLFSQHGPVHIRAQFFASNTGQCFNVRANVSGNALDPPLVNDGMAIQIQLPRHACDAASGLYCSIERGFNLFVHFAIVDRFSILASISIKLAR